MSTIKSSNEHLTLNADGSSKDIKFQANGVEKASIDSSGNLTVSGNLTSVGIDDNADATAITIDSSENVGIGTASIGTSSHNFGGQHNLTLGGATTNSFSVLEIAGNDADDGAYIGAIEFVNKNNSDAASATAEGIGAITTVVETGDSNAQDDSGGHLQFWTKAAEGNLSKKLEITSDGRGLSQFTAQSWVRVNMNGGHSTVDSHNISSISDGGTGVCTVNIATDPANANYGVVAAPYDTSNGSESVSSIGTGTFTVKVSLVISSGVSFYDRGFTAVVFGD